MTPLLGGADLADTYRQLYRDKAQQDIAAGNKIPFLITFHFLSTLVIPPLYLAIPHKQRPWLYHARWLVLALCLVCNFRMVTHSTSGNPAVGYCAGLIAAWGTIHLFNILVWTRPQWDAKRVERYARTTSEMNGSTLGNKASPLQLQSRSNGHAKPASETNGNGAKHLNGNGHANGYASQTTAEEMTADAVDVSSNGHATNGHAPNGLRERHPEKLQPTTSLESEAETPGANGVSHKQEYFYEWQEYPENAPFSTRFDWAFDMASTMRMTGWNWAIRVIPPYYPPPIGADGKTQEPLDVIPNITPEGYVRYPTRSEFIYQTIFKRILPCYLIVDFCATLMTQDPYFVSGPEHNEPLPANLAALPPYLLNLRRTAICFPGVICAIDLAFSSGALALACFAPPILGFRAHPWHLPTAYGYFSAVLDRGLEGYWGQWWHQTFRFGFAAPTNWLVRQGYLKRGSPMHAFVGSLVAFGLSGFLHAMGSYSTVAESKWWEPPIFFLLAGVGAQIQRTLARRVFRAPIQAYAPRWLRRVGNFVFTFAWGHLINSYLLDDFGRCGLWLFEPIPFSFARMLGLGSPGGDWWRWGAWMLPTWHWGKYWWDTGLAM
ncbi:hypothetical protein PG991_001977 [Apiospora marii]|uniref:Wax synthase domain-containing protein n=1 Tax=Apiospora marii TaxID=335849 RepID=A0ABR1SNK0_9PEZI